MDEWYQGEENIRRVSDKTWKQTNPELNIQGKISEKCIWKVTNVKLV